MEAATITVYKVLYVHIAGRLSEEATFSGDTRPAYDSYTGLTGKVTYAYPHGRCSTVKDQAENAQTGAGMVRTTCLDPLGRIASVMEDSGSGSPVTTYSYDRLNNRVGVTQGSQTRTFGYDALGRLTSATNPESATIAYDYDDNGNLVRKKVAGGAATCFWPASAGICNGTLLVTTGYDGLNRPAAKQYSDGTPAVAYSYCQGSSCTVANGKGRLIAVDNGYRTEYGEFPARLRDTPAA